MLAQIIDFAEYKARRETLAQDDDPKPPTPTAPAAVIPLFGMVAAA